ncbi:MAG: SAM-dependent DNA methyltransferase, partial [Candidatus Bathyarchaeota archaeon]|nr:SAM-dependent DNA methyltransferase [Candidatus Bathyarchaeum sp.]
IKENDIPDILKRWSELENEASRKRTEQSFLVPFAEIKGNDWDLSINRYKEIEHEEVQYDSPAEIMQQLKQLDAERVDALKKLEELLG